VQFEKDRDDPFGIDTLIGEVTGKQSGGGGPSAEKDAKRKYGLEGADEREKGSKRARMEDDGIL
jgi:SNW domain-containing protein 1